MFISDAAKHVMARQAGEITRTDELCDAWITKTTQCDHHVIVGTSFCGHHKVWFGNPDLYAAVKEHMKVGMLPDEALAIEGVSPDCWRRWRDEFTGHPVFEAFLENLYRLQYQAEKNLTGIIYDHSERDWKAAAWLLKTMRPERYGDKTRVDNFVTNNTTPELDPSDASAVVAYMLSSGQQNNDDKPEEQTDDYDDGEPFDSEDDNGFEILSES